jgi:hypothetical protein
MPEQDTEPGAATTRHEENLKGITGGVRESMKVTRQRKHKACIKKSHSAADIALMGISHR